MFQCIKCGLEFGDQVPDYCPVCHVICYVCPWCGRMTDASQELCSQPDCGRPVKYVRMTPDLRDVMRLGYGEGIHLGQVEVSIERALYASQRVTVYRGRVTHTTGGRKSEPALGSTVVVREVMDECSPRVQTVISKLLALRHPNIVRTYAGAADPDRCCYYLLQAWVGDETLASTYLQESGGRLASDSDVARIGLVLAKAIEHLHSRGLVHCDITPFNVLLADDGTPVLSDFGLATLADDPGQPRGYTAGYAPVELHPPLDVPPELTTDSRVGTHTDRYMLGATLYAISCGRDGRSLHPVTRTPVLIPAPERAAYDAGLGGSPQPPLQAMKPGVHPGLASWVEVLLSVAPEKRFRSDAEMVKRIAAISRRVGKRALFRLPGLRRLRRPAQALSAVTFLLAAVILWRHSYSLVHSPRNLPALIVSDLEALAARPHAALESLRHAPGGSAEVKLRIGRLLERLGRPDEALEAYRASQALDAAYAPAKDAAARARAALGALSLQRGLQLYRAGEYFLAGRQLSRAVHCGKCSPDGYRALAHIAERRGRIASAAGYWNELARLEPRAVRPHYEAARLFVDIGSAEKAYHHALKARDLHAKPKPADDVSDDEMQRLLSAVSDACLRAAAIDLSRAGVRRLYEKIVWLGRAQDLQPSAQVCLMLGRYEEQLGDISPVGSRANHYDRAIRSLEQARKLKPDSPDISRVLARCMKKR